MVLEWFDTSKKQSVQALLARKSYTKAIQLIKLALRERRSDERLRIQLADVLVLAGRKKEAIEVFNALADDLALSGFAGKAIAILKRIQKLGPAQAEIEEKLAYLLTQQQSPSPDPWRSRRSIAAPEIGMGAVSFDMEEISDDDPLALEPAATAEPGSATPEAATAERGPGTPQAATAERGPETPQAATAERGPGTPQAATAERGPGTPQAATATPPPASAPATEAPPASAPPLGDAEPGLATEAHDELVALVENVFRPSSGGPAAPSPPSGDAVQTPLFQSLSREELTAVIHGLELRNFEPGEIVMSAGEPGDSMFILTTGTARAYMRQSDGRHVLLRVMGDGDFFGEISILTGGARTATITAVTALDVLELDKATLDSITKTYPRVREVLQEFYRERARHTAETARRSIAKRRS